MSLKLFYAREISKNKNDSINLNKRLFTTYDRIALKTLGVKLKGINIDLGGGDRGFTKYCESVGIKSFSYDYPDFNIETDALPHSDCSIDFVTLNAVIEHIYNPSNILIEIKRVLKSNGLIFIRTPNWQLDYKNFYNDPTHVKPYTPIGLKSLLTLFGFKVVFLEPGLVEKAWFWWKIFIIKWRIASMIKGGTKSIICVGVKKQCEY